MHLFCFRYSSKFICLFFMTNFWLRKQWFKIGFVKRKGEKIAHLWTNNYSPIFFTKGRKVFYLSTVWYNMYFLPIFYQLDEFCQAGLLKISLKVTNSINVTCYRYFQLIFLLVFQKSFKQRFTYNRFLSTPFEYVFLCCEFTKSINFLVKKPM